MDPGLDAPQTDELLLGVEHALLPGVRRRLEPDLPQAHQPARERAAGVRRLHRRLRGGRRRLLCPAFSAANINQRRPSPHRVGLHPGDLQRSRCPDGSYPQRHLVPAATGRHHPRRPLHSRTATASRSTRAPRWCSTSGSPTAGCCAATSPGRTGSGAACPSSELENPTAPAGRRRPSRATPSSQGSGTGSGSKGGIYINSEWSYSVNGLYQIAPDRPWGFNAAAEPDRPPGLPAPLLPASRR